MGDNEEFAPVYYASGSQAADRVLLYPEHIEELRMNGFCFVRDPLEELNGDDMGIQMVIMDNAEKRRFALSSMAKHMMSVSVEEGYVAGPHKEMFHFKANTGSTKKPDYWHIPTAPGAAFDGMKECGEFAFNGINARVLNLLRDTAFQQEVFTSNTDYEHWINAVRDSSEHVMTSVLYHGTNPSAFHSTAHTDPGLLSIYSNPGEDMEFFLNGEYIAPLPMELREYPSVMAIVCGDALERATNGLFRATRHRIRNNGTYRSRKMTLNIEGSMVISPPSILACVDTSLLDALRSSTSLHRRELMGPLKEIDTSRSTSTVATLPSSNMEEDMIHGSLGSFDTLPSFLVLAVFDWLRDIKDLFSLSLVSHSLHRIANSDVLCVPAAESLHIDWGGALDRIDLGVNSHRRILEQGVAPMAVGELLESVSNRWISLLGAELTQHEMRMNDVVIFSLVSSLDGESTYFRIRFGSKLRKAFVVMSERTGINLSALRFYFNGRLVTGDLNSSELGLRMYSRITYEIAEIED